MTLTTTPLIQHITQQLPTLSEDELHTLKEFVDYLVWKHHLSHERSELSAEARAIERIQDLENPSQWITVIEAEEEINEADLDTWLKSRGYQD
jgi:hypothetical protein